MFDKNLNMKTFLILGLVIITFNFLFIFVTREMHLKKLSLTSSTYTKFIWFGIAMRLMTHIWIDYLCKSYGNILCKN